MEATQFFGGLNEAQGWAIGAAVVALLIAVAVSLIATNRARAASEALTEAGMKESRALLRQHGDEQVRASNRVEQLESSAKGLHTLTQRYGDEQAKTGDRVEQLARELLLTRTQVALQQAVVKGLTARTHLAEQNTGLAERDLTTTDAALERALELAPAELKPRIEEARRSLSELKQGVEARTFPVTSVEMLTDRIDALMTLELPGAVGDSSSTASAPVVN